MREFSKDIDTEFIKVTVATAHPAKFADSVERILREEIKLPDALQTAMNREKVMDILGPTLDELREYLGEYAQ